MTNYITSGDFNAVSSTTADVAPVSRQMTLVQSCWQNTVKFKVL